ncbi:hypothetical protein GQ54DRAFT_296892 [Martensiomyces pterosporus]|nr:hypothetical protein GQ54DRAFT_296892 [Martensiomyces pterosporus]
MAVYTCKICQVSFDSKTWYQGHLQKAHGASGQPEIPYAPSPPSSTGSATCEKPKTSKWWPRRLLARLSNKLSA